MSEVEFQKIDEQDLRNIRSSEYASLRQEMLDNKKLIFERPFIIIGGIGLAVLKFETSPLMLVLPSFLIFLLCINLSLTANRLRSNARISGYLAAIIEPGISWIGWEN